MTEEQEQQIIEGNTLIAKFMGAVIIEHYPDHDLLDFLHRDNYPDNNRYYATTSLKYHKEWNWIIPVVRKIKGVDETTSTRLYFYNRKIDMDLTNLNIEQVHTSIVEFIKAYNKGGAQ